MKDYFYGFNEDRDSLKNSLEQLKRDSYQNDCSCKEKLYLLNAQMRLEEAIFWLDKIEEEGGEPF